MTLGDFFRWVESLVPECDETVMPSISTSQLCKRDILNEGTKEFVKLTRCLPKEKKFSTSAGIPTYSITSNISDFSEFREEGVYHCRSDSSLNWHRLTPTTIRELDQERPTWRNQSSADTLTHYWQDGDILGTYYTPTYALTNGFWAYYYAVPQTMNSSTDYPFTGSTTEDKRLSAYDNALITYYEAKALGFLGYKDDSANKMKEFYDKCMVAKSLLQSRRDLAQSSKVRMKTGLNINPFKK